MTQQIAMFGLWDYVVLTIMLLISASIGVYYRFTGGKQKTTQEYLLADKNMSVIPVAFSLMASFMSAITLLGVSTENYMFGAQFVVINLSYGIFTPVAAYLYLPVFFKLQATSAYEYLEKRFGSTSRLVASLVYSLQMIFYMGIVLYAPALALEALTGINKNIAIIVIGVVCIFYSTIGGMKAVLITDVFQSLLMFAAVFSVVICAVIQTGGIDEIWKIAESKGRINLLNFDLDPTIRHTWWSLIIGGGVTFLSLYAVNQTQVQRYLTVKDLKTAQKCLWLNWPILTALSLSTSFSGLAIFSKYYNCDPVKTGRIHSTDQLMPLYVVESMGNIPGISGLFVAGIFSASLSSVSATVNCLTAVTLEDYLKPLHKKLLKKPLSEKYMTFLSKFLAFFFGWLCVGIAFLSQFLSGLLQAALTLFGAIGGPLLGIFTLGMFSTVPNEKGALTGLISGLMISIWIAFGGPRPKPPTLSVSVDGCNVTQLPIYSNWNNMSPISTFVNDAPVDAQPLLTDQDTYNYFWLYRLSYLWVSVIGFLTTMIIGWICSYLIQKCSENNESCQQNPDLFIPPIAKKLRKKYPIISLDCEGSLDKKKQMTTSIFHNNDVITSL